MKDKSKIILPIGICLIIITAIICFTLIWLNIHPYPFAFKMEMDNNTFEAVKLIDGINERQQSNCITSHLLHYSKMYDFDIEHNPILLFNGDCVCMTSPNNYTWFENIEILDRR